MKRLILLLHFLIALLAVGRPAFGATFDELKSVLTKSNATTATASALPPEQIVNGLKEALGKGVERAVASLGRTDGFLTNLNVKIPMPAKLQSVEKGLRVAGQGQHVDEFIASMNRAAEKAVPTAAAVFSESIRQMSMADANAILSGPNDAA